MVRRLIAVLWVILLSTSALAQADREASQGNRKAWATYTDEKITVDGRLTEMAWQQAPAATDFIQKEPYPGQPATERAEVRFLYDRNALYVGAILYNQQISGLVTNELKRDFLLPTAGDLFVVLLDTFHDGRNCYAFETNPGGALRELQSFDQGRLINTNWDTVWYVKTTTTANSWVVEMAIPFKSVRFPKSDSQVWGLQIEYFIRRKNEDTYWSPLPRQFNLFDMTYAGELDGLKGLRTGRNLRITPFVVSSVGTSGTPGPSNARLRGDGGVDAKYGIGTNMVLDASYRTDFSQVEVDEQQINLTRFSLFFPEKRTFFLENAGFFQIGDRLPPQIATPRGTTDILPFFSRRVGLSEAGDPVPIAGGVRLTGKTGRTLLGLLDIQTEDHLDVKANNYAVGRISREFFGNSSVGAFFFHRQGTLPADSNGVWGLDTKLNLFRHRMDINAYLMRSSRPNPPRRDEAGRLTVAWTTNTRSAFFSATSIGDNFQNDLGFIPRSGVRIFTGELVQKFRPRATYRWIREYVPQLDYDLVTDQKGKTLTRFATPAFTLNFSEGSSFTVRRELQFERLLKPFQIDPSTAIPPGGYPFALNRIAFTRNASHWLSGTARYGAGSFYDGRIRSLGLGVRLRHNEHLAIGTSYDRSAVALPHGNFSTDLASARVDYSFNPSMFLNAFVQYNSQVHTVVTNVRFNLIYRPLSDLFVVYTRRQGTGDRIVPGRGQALIVKFTRRFDF